ncbi:threonine aldolase family protein [Arcticibacterium luteifluviistationis]|uniref:Threonine aldolase n=1 Tax=Arcticibacterium luteifluviistationis TaxID=1784714 RepID=A0A2Z4GCH3_9BACT|nr:GntG family PLP-dependent aldolase [Arcticibacterium luteifluviistationis]AWV98790.1 threonine aldolase [Arcticibacterium luteifluviistationis]
MIADFRSDTITQPTAGMKEAMFSAPLGDDVFGDDPTVNALQDKVAKLFGMEAALFCASGTMANQLAIKVQTTPGTQVICADKAHVYLYEGGGIAANALATTKTLESDSGLLTAKNIGEAINPTDDIHFPPSVLVCLENTMNKGGGVYYDFEEIKKIKTVCEENNLKLHLDGARLFNALVETKETPKDYGQVFDSISICLSKGLGCPIGSVLIGSKALIEKARRQRKAWGGGWRQAGLLAAAGIYALDHHVERLKEDHAVAKEIGEALKGKSWVKKVYPVKTNIVIFELANSILAKDFVTLLEKQNVKCVTFGKHLVRFVTHLDLSQKQITYTKQVLGQLNF